MNRFLLVLLCAAVPLYAQFVLEQELSDGKTYRLVYSNPDNRRGEEARNYVNDEQRGIELRNLFIALPPGSRPAVAVAANDVERLPSDKYTDMEEVPAEWTTVKGYVWLGNSYCLHLAVSPVLRKGNGLYTVRKFTVEIAISIPENNAAATADIDPMIDNPVYGPRWRAQRPTVTVPATDAWIDYTADYVKLGVVRDGIYRIRYSDLISVGVDPSVIEPERLRIYMRGKEVPLFVAGQHDGSFDQEDYIEFLGRRNYGDTRYRQIAPYDSSFYEYLNRYSDTTIYWLNWSGAPGLRVDTVLQASGPAADTLRYYDQLLHTERDVFWDFSLSGGDLRRNFPELLENETWQDGTLGVGTFNANFTVSNLFPNRPARAFVKLQDFASSLTSNAHNLALAINSAAPRFDSGFIDKYQGKVLAAQFMSSLLVNGTNTVRIHSYAVPGNTVNTVIRDWYELEYPRYLRTTTDSLNFSYNNLSAGRVSRIAVSGITGSDVSLYKFIHSDSSIIKITNFVWKNDTLAFIDSVMNGISYFLLRSDKVPAPLIFQKKKFTNLRTSSHQADYLIITHPVFLPDAVHYLEFIQTTYNVTGKLIDVYDICDEFNYGMWAPEPIREFLKSTHAYWKTPLPKYVMLLGKGTYDYYGNKTRYAGVPRTPNYVPPYGNPVSDIWFVLWDSTGALIPQMSIGRIPARNTDEFQAYFSKHRKYVSKGFDDWNKRYLFFSGGAVTDLNQLAQSKGVNDFIINNYVQPAPVGGSSTNFYKTPSPNVTNFGPYSQEFINDRISSGGVFISYIGHSGTQTWDNSITDISQLENTRDRNPMISDFGCSTGKFAEPDITSFSENAVTNVKGQAIAYIGNSSLGFTSTAYTFPSIFYKKLLVDTSASIGDIHRLAKIDYRKQYGSSGSYGLFTKTNSLIGDPIVRLPIPVKPNLSFATTVITVTPDPLTDQHDSVQVALSYFNFGKVLNDSVSLSTTVQHNGSVIFSRTIRRKMPLFQDELAVTIPLPGTSGELTISCTIDSAGVVDEIYENDNSFVYQTVIASTTIRNLAISERTNQSGSSVRFLNPTTAPAATEFYVDVSSNAHFSPHTSTAVVFDTFTTSFPIDAQYSGERFWLRSRSGPASPAGLIYSYVAGTEQNILLNDSASFNSVSREFIEYSTEGLRLDTALVTFSALSGGFNDGNTAVISKDNQNYIAENTVRGFHVCVFDSVSHTFKWNIRFDVQAGVTQSANFTTFLDTLSFGNILIVAVSNDVAGNASLFPATLKTAIRNYGSRYIDSVKVSDSWAMIGRKGMPAGSALEKFSKRYALGRPIAIESTIVLPYKQGRFTFPEFGPVSHWKNMKWKYSLPMSGAISFSVVGRSQVTSVDTLLRDVQIDSMIDLSEIDAEQYPFLRILGGLSAGVNGESPSITSWELNYTALPELGTNYQVFKGYHLVNNAQGNEIASTDTIVQGAKVQFRYRIYNAGGSTAKQVGYRLTSTWDNNYVETVAGGTVDSIPAESYKEIVTQYSTSLGSGRRTIQLSIDPDTTIRELYKDNNFYTYPLIVKKSPGNPVLPNLVITQNAVTSVPAQITDETDTARFTIVYANTGALVNDSVSIKVRHYFQSEQIAEYLIRRKYPVTNDTITVLIPIARNAGSHQLSVELDHTGLITESNESDNSADYFFTVATTDFKVISPIASSIAHVDKIVFLNPTVNAGPGSVLNLQLDTLADFTTAHSFMQTLQPFATAFPLPGLKNSRRYHWRIKVQGGTRDWTKGSFYSGDSATPALGQIDSIGWAGNNFKRAAFTDSGVRIVDSRFVLKAMSAGFADGNNGSVEVNGVNVITAILGSGHNVAVLDTVSYTIVKQRRFDLAADASEADSLVQFIASVPAGFRVIDVVVDEGSNNLQPATRNALKSIGSALIDQLSFRDSWAIIGRKGAAPGSVPEVLKPQGTGIAFVDTTIVRPERSGSVETPLIGPFTTLSDLRLNSQIPAGSQLTVQFIGLSPTNSYDTLVTAVNQGTIPLTSVNTKKYRNGKILFSLNTGTSLRAKRAVSAASSPVIYGWSMGAASSTELAVSGTSSTIDRNQVMEGEQITFTGTIFNVSTVAADTVLARLTTNASGIEQIIKEQRFTTIAAGDSAPVTFVYDTRGKRGNHAFTFTVDPLDSVSEQTKSNNSVSIPYIVTADTLRPTVQVTIDGLQVLNGDYVGKTPEIRIRYTDNNPSNLLPSDTTNFLIRLNNGKVPFVAGTAELTGLNSPGRAEIRWTPELAEGENIIQISAKDVSENFSDTILLYVNVSSEFRIMDLFNIPNPFVYGTQFTFNLAGPVTPEQTTIRIYTIAGRLIQEIETPSTIGFNKIAWDGRDNDGDEIGNGVYIYKVIVKQGTKQTEGLSKLVKMR